MEEKVPKNFYFTRYDWGRLQRTKKKFIRVNRLIEEGYYNAVLTPYNTIYPIKVGEVKVCTDEMGQKIVMEVESKEEKLAKEWTKEEIVQYQKEIVMEEMQHV